MSSIAYLKCIICGELCRYSIDYAIRGVVVCELCIDPRSLRNIIRSRGKLKGE